MKSRIMYIEDKSEGLDGPARVGRVTFSRSGRSLYYRGREFRRSGGFKSNYYEVETGDAYWISGPRRDGNDRLYGGSRDVGVDDDVAEEYWREIRGRRSR
jgi:hypothetical protein